jgi:hypothetical protein
MGLLFGLLQTGAFAAGLIALHRADARAAFGVTRPAGGRRVWGIVTLAGVGFALVLFSFIQWKAQRVTFTDWTASPMMMAGACERTGATLHFTEASTAGSVLLLNIYSEPGFQPHAVTPQFAGAAAMVSQAMVPDGLSTDCLLEPRRGDNVAGDEGGHLLAGSRELTGPGTLRIGFVFPSVELAGLARDQVQKDWVGRTRILERPEVLVLFQLQRSKLVDPATGQPMEEGFLGSLAFNHANPAKANLLPAPVAAEGPKSDILIRLDLARQNLAELRKQAEVGIVAPQGKEMLAAELAVTVAEAELKGDAMAAAKGRLNHAEKILSIVEAMFGVGKATAAEVRAAKLAVAEAAAGVTELEPLLPNSPP